jgi:hypothetical protein
VTSQTATWYGKEAKTEKDEESDSLGGSKANKRVFHAGMLLKTGIRAIFTG